MSIKYTKGSFKVDGDIEVKDTNTANTNTDNFNGSWEFFKNTFGIITDFMNKQIMIPSTAFTPDFPLPTKAILLNIVKAKEALTIIKNKVKQLSNAMDKDNSSTLKQKQIVKINIVNAYNKYKESQ